MKDFIFDIEVYHNIFTAVFYDRESSRYFTFEVSERRNDAAMFCGFVHLLGAKGHRMVGYNNCGYDYPVIHYLLTVQQYDPLIGWEDFTRLAKEKSDAIIGASNDQRFAHIIWDRDMVAQQIDLYKIHHFDNQARSTSLKVLEFNMRSHDIQELPFDPTKPVSVEDMPRLLSYNKHDVAETNRFYCHTLSKIKFREELGARMGTNFLNANDTAIGKRIFQKELEKKIAPDICYRQVNGKRTIRQTHRKQIVVEDIIFPYVEFERPEFRAVVDWMRRQVFAGSNTKSVFTGLDPATMGSLADHCDMKTSKKKEWGPEPMVRNLNCIVDGVHFVFGTGGLHACVDPVIVESDDQRVIIDIDVASYYPNLAIKNEVFPAHLGPEFCEIYDSLFQQRQKFAKGTPENAALKLALNGVYGDSNNVYSPFYDPQYTMTITLNGQLLLCLLAERLMKIGSVELIQANTDGVTVLVARDQVTELKTVCAEWEMLTDLTLEFAEYSRMFVRDVNSYIAERVDGKIKRKGAYEYDIDWHQNHSALVIQKAAEAHLLHGTDVREFLKNHDDPFDFYLRTKVPRSSHLDLVTDLGDGKTMAKRLQNITRYFISQTGGSLMKVMPPLKKNPDKWREISVNKGWLVTVHDQVAPLEDVDFDFYHEEAMKLITPLKRYEPGRTLS